MCFTDFVGSPETRYGLAKVFIGVVGAFVLVHVSILVFAMCKKIVRKIRAAYFKKRNNRLINARKAVKEGEVGGSALS